MRQEVDPRSLSRTDRVAFRYLTGRKVLDVEGTVDKITYNYISVGNESWLGSDGIEIYHARKYRTKNIQNLVKVATS
jgi:hypothetical protein